MIGGVALIAAARLWLGRGSHLACTLPVTAAWSGSRGDCPAQSSAALLAEPLFGHSEEASVGRVVIGMDPHKRSATIEIIDDRETVLAGGRFGTDRDGHRAMLTLGR